MKAKNVGAIIAVAVAAAGAYVAMSGTYVGQGEVGVVYTAKSGVKEKTLGPGFQFVGPLAKVKDYPVSQQQLVLSNNAADFNEKKVGKRYSCGCPGRWRYGENEYDRKLQFHPGKSDITL